MTTKSYLYERPRVPLKIEPSSDEHLVVWRSDPKNKKAYLEARIREVRAPKTIIVWKHVVSTLLDPSQIHLRVALQKMIVVEKDRDSEVKQMIEFLKSNPPFLTLFDFGASQNDLALTDMRLRDRVFLCSKLCTVLEQTENNTPLDIQLRYLVFNALLHEMGHWLHFEPNRRQTSGRHLRYRDWFGANVGISETVEERFGEAGYFMEGELWGGIIEYTFPHVGLKGAVKGLYQKPNGNTLRAFEGIGIVVRHPGDVKDTKREQISLEAMAKRLTPGTIIEGFADDELVPMFSMKKDAKEVWIIEDPVLRTDTDDEGRRRSKRRRLPNGAARSRFAMFDSDDIDVLFATAEFVSKAAQSFIDEQ